jgi:hypothetical protein
VVTREVLNPEVIIVGEEKHKPAVVHFPESRTVDHLVGAANAEARRNTKGRRNAPKGNRSKFNVLSDVLREVTHAEDVDPDVEHGVQAEPIMIAHLGLLSAGRVVGILANEEVKEGHEAETSEEGEEGPVRVSRVLVAIYSK